MPSERTRGYVYRIGVAIVPVLTAHGFINESQASLWLGVLGAVLGLGMAAMNTSTEPPEG